MKTLKEQLLEEFNIFEAPINATGYDPDQVQYAWDKGKANPNYPGAQVTPGPDTSDYTDPKGTDNVTNDPVKDKPKDKDKTKRSRLFDPSVQAIQNLFNSLGIPDNAGNKLSPDGVWGWRTEEAKHNFYKKYKKGSKEEKQVQDLANKVKPEFQWRLIADRDGRTARGGADMSKPKDPAIGEPTTKALMAMGLSADGQGTQNASPSGNANLDVLNKVPNPTHGMEYWVNGSRFEYRGGGRTGVAGGWYKNLDPSDTLQWSSGETSNRALSSSGYTGPDDDVNAKKQFLASKKQNTQVASNPSGRSTQLKESTELDTIRFLSGLK